MSTLNGNTLHIMNYQRKGSGSLVSSFYKHGCDVKAAQFILGKTELAPGAKEWKILAQSLYKSVIKSWSNSSDYLVSATNTVIDWNSQLTPASFTEFEGFIGMNILLDWQTNFVELLKNKENTLGVYFFEYMGNNHAWVVVNNPSTEMILDYSNTYIDFLEENADIHFEFMVYGKQEIQGTPVPEHCIYVNCEE